MPTVEEEALAAVAKDADGKINWPLLKEERERLLAERHQQLLTDAQATFRAMDGWSEVQTQEEWAHTVEQADEDFTSGHFLIDRLGGERFLDPPLIAVLLRLRRRLIEEQGATTAAELMMVDSAVLSYYHMMRVNGWIGNMAWWFEADFFRKERPGAHVEGIVSRISEQLMPLLDRSNRMMLRNLKALKVWRQPPTPTVSVGSTGQVNVGAQQVNQQLVQESSAENDRR